MRYRDLASNSFAYTNTLSKSVDYEKLVLAMPYDKATYLQLIFDL